MSQPLDPSETLNWAKSFINKVPDFGALKIAQVCQSHCLTKHPALVQVVQFCRIRVVTLMELCHEKVVPCAQKGWLTKVIFNVNPKLLAAAPQCLDPRVCDKVVHGVVGHSSEGAWKSSFQPQVFCGHLVPLSTS